MNFAGLRFRSFPFIFIFVSPAVGAAQDAHAWLAKMNEAARSINYVGTFVYQHDQHLESMRILHKVRDGTAYERLVSLNDAAREVIRNEREVRCYLPDKNSVVVEHRKAETRNFPAILPQSLRDLERNYTITLGKNRRVADRNAQGVIIRPKDAYRYGYQLWADRATGLLLKANLIDDQDRVVEQFMFTEIVIGADIADADLEPRNLGKDYVWYRSNNDGTETKRNSPATWTASQLPDGFNLTMQITRKVPTRKLPVEHLVYSDGMAVVSVFVEKLDSKGAADEFNSIDGLTQVGAVHAYSKLANGYQITAVGEVPAATVDLIAESMIPAP